MFRQSDNLLTLNIGYPKTFGILFSEKTDQIFLNNQIIQLGDKKGISINGGGYVNVDYYYLGDSKYAPMRTIWLSSGFIHGNAPK